LEGIILIAVFLFKTGVNQMKFFYQYIPAKKLEILI